VRRRPAPAKEATVLQVIELFSSIQGETHLAGYPCAFVRLASCNLHCRYCDTRYACEEAAEPMSLDAIVEWVCGRGLPWVEITGGEPLLQEETPDLIVRLLDEGLQVMIETNGSLPLRAVDGRAVVIMDLKTPGSGMSAHNLLENLAELRAGDAVKFVITSREDYEWARAMVAEGRVPEACERLFSPARGYLEPATLASWIVADALPVRFQLQLHRVLWPDRERGV
jgi:7-carboxy-7-deazaguanine synthase